MSSVLSSVCHTEDTNHEAYIETGSTPLSSDSILFTMDTLSVTSEPVSLDTFDRLFSVLS